jgi:hypothetical protein
MGLAIVSALMVTGTSVAHADSTTTLARWRNCDTLNAAVKIRATFSDPARYFGEGRYMVKKSIKWQKVGAGGNWIYGGDDYYAETGWLKVTNVNYDFVSTAGDRTNWGNVYPRLWRAKVTIQLLKNRPGPRDKKVAEFELTPRKAAFQETGTQCGVDF